MQTKSWWPGKRCRAPFLCTRVGNEHSELALLPQEDQRNDDECWVCKSKGDYFVLCDKCPRSFHLKCHLPHMEDADCGWAPVKAGDMSFYDASSPTGSFFLAAKQEFVGVDEYDIRLVASDVQMCMAAFYNRLTLTCILCLWAGTVVGGCAPSVYIKSTRSALTGRSRAEKKPCRAKYLSTCWWGGHVFLGGQIL